MPFMMIHLRRYVHEMEDDKNKDLIVPWLHTETTQQNVASNEAAGDR